MTTAICSPRRTFSANSWKVRPTWCCGCPWPRRVSSRPRSFEWTGITTWPFYKSLRIPSAEDISCASCPCPPGDPPPASACKRLPCGLRGSPIRTASTPSRRTGRRGKCSNTNSRNWIKGGRTPSCCSLATMFFWGIAARGDLRGRGRRIHRRSLAADRNRGTRCPGTLFAGRRGRCRSDSLRHFRPRGARRSMARGGRPTAEPSRRRRAREQGFD